MKTGWIIKHIETGRLEIGWLFYSKKLCERSIAFRGIGSSYKPVKVYISETDPRKKGN